MLQMHCGITSGGVEEVLRLTATSGDQLDLQALEGKYAVRVIGPPLLGVLTPSNPVVESEQFRRLLQLIARRLTKRIGASRMEAARLTSWLSFGQNPSEIRGKYLSELRFDQWSSLRF